MPHRLRSGSWRRSNTQQSKVWSVHTAADHMLAQSCAEVFRTFCLGSYSLPSPGLHYLSFACAEDVAPVGRPDFQAQALAKFATALVADPHGVLPLWTGDSHPCGDASNNYKAWPGITCDAPTGFVTAVRLHGKGLKGPVPSSLSLLKSLRTLDLSNNSFQGQLPSSWSNLSSLEQCDLSTNQLSRSLPPTYSSWSAIQSLDLHGNNLSGPLPATWASMNLLEVRWCCLAQVSSTYN